MLPSPKRAPVKPRVFTRDTGEAIPLEDEIQALLAAGGHRVVNVLGSGEDVSEALRHLAAVLPAGSPVRLSAEAKLRACLLVGTAPTPGAEPAVLNYRLAPWTHDDLIEYLLAVHRDRCASAISRVQKSDHDRLRGIPDLWKLVLDQLADDPSIPDVRGALGRYLRGHLSDTDLIERARSVCLNMLTTPSAEAPSTDETLAAAGFTGDVVRALRHAPVQLVLATERAVADLQTPNDCDFLALRLPRALVQAVAADIAGDDRALRHLRDLLAGPTWSHAMAASLLHAASPGWMPQPGRLAVLAGAYLEHAAWFGVELPGCDLSDADLSDSDFRWAKLENAVATRAFMRRARLANANLEGFRAVEAALTGADLASVRGTKSCWDDACLEDANFEDAVLDGATFRGTNCKATTFAGATLVGATFADADLTDANFAGADLRGARLEKLCLREADFAGACFTEANLSGSDLEEMELSGVDFRCANLRGALLTGARVSDADLRGACLREAGLGDVNLERAQLNGADLRGATFHLGSTRSGLLFTPIASEGTRTGFYTDDADEQTFKAPEEIRKANLCGADLRGARIEGVDFYLVDLRGAKYDREQELHFRRCRAILAGQSEEAA